MDYLTKYYKSLSEQLQERINVLESFMPRKQGMPPFGLPWPMPPSTKNIPVDEDERPVDPNHGPPVSRPQDRKQPKDKLGKYDPKKKIAKKDYDKDGKVESSEDEWRGSRDRAIKRSMQNENFNRALGMRPLPEPGGVVQAYAGTPGDGVPDVATYTTAQERAARDQARIRPIDTFGGQYPSPEFGDLARSADSARRAAYPLEGKLREAEIEAQRQHMRTTKYRGRPVSHMSPGSKAYQAAMTAFRTGYQPPEDLAAQLRGSQILSKLSQRILQAHPQYDQFEKDEELRGDIILGRKNSDGTWRQSYLRDRYTGD